MATSPLPFSFFFLCPSLPNDEESLSVTGPSFENLLPLQIHANLLVVQLGPPQGIAFCSFSWQKREKTDAFRKQDPAPPLGGRGGFIPRVSFFKNSRSKEKRGGREGGPKPTSLIGYASHLPSSLEREGMKKKKKRGGYEVKIFHPGIREKKKGGWGGGGLSRGR